MHASRQRHRRQLFHDLLPGEIIIRAFGKGERDDGKPRHRDGPHIGQVWDAGNLAFDRQRDGALHVLRRLARQLGYHAHLHVLNVGKRLDGKIGQGVATKSDQRRDEHEYEYALRQRKYDQAVNHYLPPVSAISSASSSRAPLVTTRSSLFRPSPT